MACDTTISHKTFVALEIPLVAYPPEARRKKISGTVTIKVFVNESGDVYEAMGANGPASLRKAALGSARGAKFPPFILGDKPTKCAGILIYTFNQPN
jgi:TonB family protein